MTREDNVTVRVKGGGAAHFAMGMRYGLTLAAGESSAKWNDGSPITRAEFDAMLAADGPEASGFEIVPGRPSRGLGTGRAPEAT